MTTTIWWFVTIACLAWYSTITVYVAIRAALDIKHMLARLRDLETTDEDKRH